MAAAAAAVEGALGALEARLGARVRKKLALLEPKQLAELHASGGLDKFVRAVAAKEQAALEKKGKKAGEEAGRAPAVQPAADGMAAQADAGGASPVEVPAPAASLEVRKTAPAAETKAGDVDLAQSHDVATPPTTPSLPPLPPLNAAVANVPSTSPVGGACKEPVAKGGVLNINIGVLGHVDSGKTSLCRAMSTVGSTAAFDKHPQSKERGITLDLGFSSFMMDVPSHLTHSGYDSVQVTLVDCPGHASLIRTIIGGAQIIDLMILVIDVTKGVQTQTAECLVIGEITNEHMVIVLNKLDMLPEDSREKQLKAMETRIRKTLAATKFHDAPMVAVAARPGGATSAATDMDVVEGVGIAQLVDILRKQLHVPTRAPDGPFMFAVDHCFAIKGQGTVLTGTVLSGSVKIGQEIELPELKLTRKVKSMQMFRKPVQAAYQGDRLGICVTQLDAKNLERGIACSLGHVTLVSIAIISVRQIRYFKATCKTKSKFHVTIGHSTVMGTATFFGPPKSESPIAKLESKLATLLDNELDEAKQAAALALAKTPLPTSIDLSKEYEYQDELHPMRADQWAVLELEHPLPCAIPAVLIGSHLDVDANSATCRLAFHGRLLHSVTKEEVEKLRIFKHKLKEGQIERVQDERTVICKNLFKPGTNMNLFNGMAVQLGETGPLGIIDGTFGKNKFKVVFEPMEGGLAALQEACKKARIILRYKRFVFDPSKKMVQSS